MDTEEISHLMHGVHKGFHALPAAGFFTGRCIIRMLIVITWLSPAIQMHVHFLYAKLMKGSGFLLTLCKGIQGFIILRMRFIIEAGFRLHALLDSGMHHGTADEVVDGRILGSFLCQSL